MQMAEEAGLDLVEISPTAVPPVCKIMDFGKFKYETQKREAEARKKQKIIEIKEIKFRPGTDTHDYDVKMRSVVKFLEEGDKVKVTLRFRGREMAHQDLGLELLKRVEADVAELGKIEILPPAGRPPDGDDDRPEIGLSFRAVVSGAFAPPFSFRVRSIPGRFRAGDRGSGFPSKGPLPPFRRCHHRQAGCRRPAVPAPNRRHSAPGFGRIPAGR